MNTSQALILGLIMLGSTIRVESQRAPNKWWNEIKTNRNSVSNLSDDQLLTEASRLNSNLIRVPAPSTINEKHVHFDDQPYDSLGSESQFMRRSTVFDSQNSPDNSRDRIWSYFDSKLKNRDGTQSPSSGTSGSLFSSFERRQSPSSSSSSSRSSDDFFSRHFKRNSNNPGENNSKKPNQHSSRASSKTNNSTSKDRVLALDFGQTRRKNSEEKERWNQLIKSIFESSPRANSNSNQYDSDGNFDYKSMTKTKIVEPNEDEGVITEKSVLFESNENALKNESEDNANMKDMQMDGDDENDDDGSAKAATTMSTIIQDEESENEADEGADEQENDEDNETGARKRHATVAPTPMEQEEEDDEASNTVDNDENNQYLRPQNKTKLSRPPPTTAATTPATVNLNTKVPTRRQPQNSPSVDSFGSRLHRSNLTSFKKPSFTMHFEMGKKKVEDKIIKDLKKDPMFHPVDSNVSTTTPRASTEVFDGVSKEMKEEMDNSADSTTPLPLTSTLRPFKNRKSVSGKWMDSETFKLNEDRSMVMDPNEEEDDEENEVVTVSPVPASKRASRMSATPLTTRSPVVIQKRKLQTQVRRKAVMANFRPVRQNSEFLEEDSLDEVSRLSRALPGTPGQDYPMFSTIPQTSFDCSAHQWPGYYADVDTQCQVFHICQSGGRRDSFLCPNGTMFNQQLFICDWWHNVKCPEVTQHYALNQQIYDYSWESKRINAESTSQKSPKSRLAKRMGVSDETTTLAPSTQVSTTSTNAEQVSRRVQHLQNGIKGRSRFGRQANNEKNAIKAFFERYKYVQSTTEAPSTEKPNKIIAASGSSPVLTFTTINDQTVRHPKHHRA